MRTILIILAVLVVVALVAVGFGWSQVRLAWPQTDGNLQLSGLKEQVTIIRDRRGVPHIYASNPHDLFMAQGFVQAQDRFWQMEFWRRIGQGRLSELFGESTLGQDRFLRTIGVLRSAELSWKALDTDSRDMLEAYAQGVNAYIEQNKNKLPLEFRVLGLTGVKFMPEPWKPLDSLTWATMMAYNLGGNYEQELNRAELMARYGEPWMRELSVFDYPPDFPLIIPSNVAWDKVDTHVLAGLPADMLLGKGAGIGSNNWVVSGSRTESGKPLLANDPHLLIQMPSIWYENGLHCQPVNEDCPYNVAGFIFPSAPGVVIGHNDRIAWGVTNNYPDVQDLYIERINPDNANQYEVNGRWEEMQITHEEIKVAGRDKAVPLTIRRTRHGPIINDVAYGTESKWAHGWQPLALRWTALDANRAFKAISLLDAAQNWDEFREALRYWDAPAQNFVYADVDGNIGYQFPSTVPIRAKGDGKLPVPGWTDEYEWTSIIPYDEMPSIFNPPQGYIVTANNRVVGAEYPYMVFSDGDYGFRAQRIVEMMESRQVHNVETMKAIQGDNANVFARELIPYLQELPLDRPEVKAMRDRLLTWNLQQSMDSAEAAYWEATWYMLTSAILSDELGDQLARDRGFVLSILPDTASHWWDNTLTSDKESRDDILVQSLNQAYDLLVEKLGDDPGKWRWGALHTATFRNQTLGESGISVIENMFNRGPYETSGGNSIINATSWSDSPDELFQVAALPSLRIIVDLADLNRSVSTNTTGQSGHPYHKHYADQVDQWRQIRYAPLYWDRNQLEQNAEGTLTLTP